jgi:hypothetical protein
MISGRDRVSYDGFGDCHDEIAIASSIHRQAANL